MNLTIGYKSISISRVLNLKTRLSELDLDSDIFINTRSNIYS